METQETREREGLTDFLHACRRVLTAGVLARDRSAALSLDPSRWPRGEGCTSGPVAPEPAADAPYRAMIDFGQDLQAGLAESLERALGDGAHPDVARALLDLLLDCARARFVYEETAMRLRDDPGRFDHALLHGSVLERLASAKGLLRARRPDAARAVVARFRRDLAQHEAGVAPAVASVDLAAG
jgi:hypothetical protein